jgi:phospholipase D1/2
MTSPVTNPEDTILQPGKTVWRLAHADRAAVLVDAAAYFGALRSSMAQAQHSIVIVGWDIDSRTPLVGPDGADDGAPETLLAYLEYLVGRRTNLDLRLLLWDYSILYSIEREALPTLNLKWLTPRQFHVELDNCLPLGACHHQKLVIVDGRLAFCGGLDLAVRRWDTPEHRPDHPRRIGPDEETYAPFHDMQMVVDGEAASALLEITQQRWLGATGKEFSVPAAEALWPDNVEPDFVDVAVGIARTLPASDTSDAVHEVKALYLAAIRAARRHVYIENQYLTVESIADALVARMEEVPGLQVVAVTPRLPQGWLEARTMGAAQEKFTGKLQRDDLAGRVRFRYPWTGATERTPVMVHSKMMIVDDRLIRIGSSNLNNRSMGVDSECDLAIEGTDDASRKKIHYLLCRQIGEHLGADPATVEQELASGSIVEVIDKERGGNRGLAPLAERESQRTDLTDTINLAADPAEPLDPEALLGDMFDARTRPRHRSRLLRLALVAAGLIAMVLAWQYTPLAEWADPEELAEWLEAMRGNWWIYPLFVAGYVVGGLLLFPLTVMVAVTGMVLGPWSGFLCAIAGALISGWVGLRIGAWTGGRLFESMATRAYRLVSRVMQNHGVLTVAAVRMVPIAPYTVVNIAMGATGLRTGAFLAGTFIGLLPGIFVLTMLGDRLREVWRNPEPENLFWFVLAIILWLGVAYALQRLVTILRKRAG